MLEVTAKVLNFRTEPRVGSEIIRGLVKGTLLKPICKKGDWWLVEDMVGINGWVHGAYVQEFVQKDPVNPVEYWKSEGWRLTSPYGPRTGRYAGFHRGVDMGGFPCGHPIKSPFNGLVVAAKTSGMGTWGNTVCIELSPDYVTLNAHLQRIIVAEGREVKQGDIIGFNGGSNHSGKDYSCHIHYEILRNNGSRPWRGTIWGDPETFYF